MEEDRSSPCFAKKARYSFTEDQKSTLKHAFQNDPYPTSMAIERLAAEMDLSAKTVVNWFHNHRMRSKQQNRDENGKRLNGVYVKQEPADSNTLNETPQFPCHNSYTTESRKSSPESMVTSPDSTQSHALSPPPTTLPPHLTSPQHTNSAGRKRKNANPKYVSAGAVLDKHNNGSEEGGSEEGGSEEAEDLEEIDVTGDPVEEETTSASLVQEESLDAELGSAKIAKLEQRLSQTDMDWETDEGVDREKCLQKLESSVKETDNSEWPF